MASNLVAEGHSSYWQYGRTCYVLQPDQLCPDLFWSKEQNTRLCQDQMHEDFGRVPQDIPQVDDPLLQGAGTQV